MAQIIVRLTLDTNAIGPFSIYTGSTSSTPIATDKTRDQLVAGIPISLPAEPGGTTYLLIIVNNQPGCEDNYVSKSVTVYGNTDYIDITATYSSGSVVANYTATARIAVDADIKVSFVNTLGVSTGSPVIFNPEITILSGQTTGTLTLTDGTPYSYLDGTATSTSWGYVVTGSTSYEYAPVYTYDFVGVTTKS